VRHQVADLDVTRRRVRPQGRRRGNRTLFAAAPGAALAGSGA